MKLLAIDTSTELCSVSLLINNNLIQKTQFADQQHAELIFQMLREILAESEIALNQLDYLAFGKGPGSFTGLRIATGVIQGLALGADLPVIGISTLETIAVQAQSEFVVASLDARIGELYTACYHFKSQIDLNQIETIIEPQINKPDDFIDSPLNKNTWVACGTGFSAYPQLASKQNWIQIVQTENKYPYASTIAKIAQQRTHLATSAELAIPVYIRDKVALTTKERLNKS